MKKRYIATRIAALALVAWSIALIARASPDRQFTMGYAAFSLIGALLALGYLFKPNQILRTLLFMDSVAAANLYIVAFAIRGVTSPWVSWPALGFTIASVFWAAAIYHRSRVAETMVLPAVGGEGLRTHPQAKVALSVSIFGMLCLPPFLGSAAGVVLGILARRKILQNPSSLGGARLASAAVIVGALGLIAHASTIVYSHAKLSEAWRQEHIVRTCYLEQNWDGIDAYLGDRRGLTRPNLLRMISEAEARFGKMSGFEYRGLRRVPPGTGGSVLFSFISVFHALVDIMGGFFVSLTSVVTLTAPEPPPNHEAYYFVAGEKGPCTLIVEWNRAGRQRKIVGLQFVPGHRGPGE